MSGTTVMASMIAAGTNAFHKGDDCPGDIYTTEVRDILVAALNAAEQAGYVLVPKNPDEQMELAGYGSGMTSSPTRAAVCFLAMVEARPTVSTPDRSEVSE